MSLPTSFVKRENLQFDFHSFFSFLMNVIASFQSFFSSNIFSLSAACNYAHEMYKYEKIRLNAMFVGKWKNGGE